ncbi:MAG TPA: DUF2919 family protein, partial [Methylophilaceae bacterium]|nr:DUF2919 family protein [Methylophilaceae bacterium]
ILVLSLANKTDRMGLVYLFYPATSGLPFAAAAALPAVLLLVAWVKRKPGAHTAVRWIWHHGKIFLLTSTLFNGGVALQPLILGEDKSSITGWAQLAACIIIVNYLLTAERVKDAFRDFPPESGRTLNSRH